MFNRISKKIYGIASLILLFTFLSFCGAALFINQQNEADSQELMALTSASNFFSLRQMLLQLRTWDRDVLLQGNAEAEGHFVKKMQQLKAQLLQYRDQATQPESLKLLGKLNVSVAEYESNFSQLSQLMARHKLLETDINTNYQSIESVALNQGDAKLLRKVFLLSHFQVNYFKDDRSSGFQALKIVLDSMAQAFDQSDFIDDRIRGYFAAYGKRLIDYSVINSEIKSANNNLEKKYLQAIKLFETLSNDLEITSKSAIDSSRKSRQQLKTIMYVYFPLISIVIFTILLMLARKIVTPINALLEIINKVKTGKTMQRFHPIGNLEDELNQLGISFNSMLDTLDQEHSKTLGYQAELTDKVAELAKTNQKLQREILERQIADKENSKLEDQLRQSQKMEAVGTLAGGIAHDFNNILAAIIGYTQLTRMKLADRVKERKNLDEVLIAADRAKDLVEQILVFSRKGEITHEPIQISIVVSEVIRLLRQTIPASIPIQVAIDSQTGMVVADSTQIHQIVMNLCTNAYHAVRDVNGEIAICLESVHVDHQIVLKYPHMKPGDYALLTIRDTGTGMSPAVLSRIFEPFYTTKKQGEGTGMGMAVVYGIIQNHGGFIEVESKVSTGTTFQVFLPLLSDEVSAKSMTCNDLQYGRERILFVDDDLALANLGRETLEVLGYRVTATSSAFEALEIFRQNFMDFDLVITDQAMPELSGDKLAKELLQIRSDIPIILCTGYSESMDAGRAKDIGISEYLLKPIHQVTLSNTIRQIFDVNT